MTEYLPLIDFVIIVSVMPESQQIRKKEKISLVERDRQIIAVSLNDKKKNSDGAIFTHGMGCKNPVEYCVCVCSCVCMCRGQSCMLVL